MEVLVIGAGMMGSAAAYDLAHSPDVGRVTLADIDIERARRVASVIGKEVRPEHLDINYYDDVIGLMCHSDVTIGATSYHHNLLLTKAAIESGVHFCDLGGNMEVVGRQIALDRSARTAGVCIIPNCGLAPGLACILAAGAAQQFESLSSVRLRVGGLPQHPRPPLNYQLVFSVEGLINEYLEPAEVIRGGQNILVDSMADLETLEFPPPFGQLEAFNTSGGVSTLPRMFKGKVRELDYKTIRYKGHCEKFKTLLDLGFASSEPMPVGNSMRTARELFQELLKKKLPTDGPDVVLMRVSASGRVRGSEKTLAYQMVDYYDEKTHISAMMRTTAYPTTVIAQMIANGTVTARGVHPPEECVPPGPLIEELKKRNIIITETAS